jgi:hypothetical protein
MNAEFNKDQDRDTISDPDQHTMTGLDYASSKTRLTKNGDEVV